MMSFTATLGDGTVREQEVSRTSIIGDHYFVTWREDFQREETVHVTCFRDVSSSTTSSVMG